MKKLRLKSPIRWRKKTKEQALRRAKDFIRGEDQPSGSGESSPDRVTNESMAKHREEVLSGARRFIYPLKSSKHRIAIISGIIITLVLISLLSFSWWLLYRLQSTGDFAYRISQIVPFPVAKLDGDFVRYEAYLFELRHNVHYLATQENVDFGSDEGIAQLDGLKRQAYTNAISAAVVRRLAEERGVGVSEQEVSSQIDLIRSTGGIGDATQTLEDTLKDFYGWDISDLRRVIRAQLLKQKLLPVLDTELKPKAQAILNDILDGANFGAMAKQNSEDVFTKNGGGEFGFIFRSNTEIPPQLVEKAFTLSAGEVSPDLVETLFGLHIVKTIEYRSEDEAKVAHILFRFRDIEEFIAERQADMKISNYISPPVIETETP